MDDRNETYATVLTTLCVSEMDVQKAKTTQRHKDKPLKSPEQDHKYEKVVNCQKMTVG